MASTKSVPRFIKVLTEINSYIDLSHSEANNEILKEYEKKEITGATDRSSVLIRLLVPQELTMLAKTDKPQLEAAFKLINEIYPKLYQNMLTLDNIFSTDVRRPMIDSMGRFSPEHMMSKNLVKIPWDEKAKIIKQAKKTLFEKHGNVIFVSLKETIQIIEECIASSNPYKRTIALLLACGCRPNELHLSEFSAWIPSSPEEAGQAHNWIQLDGLAKKRGSDSSNIRPLVSITVDQFLESLKFVRESVSTDLNHQITDRRQQLKPTVTSKSNELIKELFSKSTGITLYSTRAIYAHVSYKLYGQFGTVHGKAGLTKPRWISQVLGHGEDDLNTANNYNRYALNEDIETPVDIKSTKQQLKDSRFQKLEQLLQKNPGIKGYQLEELGQKASPKIPRAYVRAFFKEKKMLGEV